MGFFANRLPGRGSVRGLSAVALAGRMLVVLLGFGVAYLIFSTINDYYSDGVNRLLSWGATGLLGLAVLLNRSGRYRTAAWITIGVRSLAFLLITFYTDGVPVDLDFLNYLFLPLLIASIFFPVPVILVLGGVYAAVIYAISVLSFGFDPVAVTGGPIFFLTVACGVITLISAHRNRLESTRQGDLAEKEERYRTLLETSYAGICVIADGMIQEANPSFAQMFGYSPADMVGEPWLKLFPDERMAAIPNNHQEYDNACSCLPVARKDGSMIYIETVVRSASYRGMPAQVLAVRDITERIEAEMTIDRSERLYRSLFENANDAIFLVDLDDRIAAANQKAVDLLGYSARELVGKPIDEILAPAELPDKRRVFERLARGEVLPAYERVYRRKDGSDLCVEVNAAVVYDTDGKPRYFQGVVRDITERKFKEEQIQSQMRRLHSMQHIEQAIASSLDLRLTLNVLLTELIEHVEADAVDILLYNPLSQMLEIGSRAGFFTNALNYTQLRLDGAMPAGRRASSGSSSSRISGLRRAVFPNPNSWFTRALSPITPCR